VEQLMKAAKDGDLTTLQYLINDKKIDVNTRGPNYRWVRS